MSSILTIKRVLLAVAIALFSLLLSGCGSSSSCSVSCQNGSCQCTPSNCDSRCKTSTTTTGKPTTTTTRVPSWSFALTPKTVSQSGVVISVPPHSDAEISYHFTFKDAVRVTSLSDVWDRNKDKGLYNESYTTHLDNIFAQERGSNSTFVSAVLMQALLDNPSLQEANKKIKSVLRAYLNDLASLTRHVDSQKGVVPYRNGGAFNANVVPCAAVLQVSIVAGLLESDMICVRAIGVCSTGGAFVV